MRRGCYTLGLGIDKGEHRTGNLWSVRAPSPFSIHFNQLYHFFVEDKNSIIYIDKSIYIYIFTTPELPYMTRNYKWKRNPNYIMWQLCNKYSPCFRMFLFECNSSVSVTFIYYDFISTLLWTNNSNDSWTVAEWVCIYTFPHIFYILYSSHFSIS